MSRKWNAKAERAKTKQAGQLARNRHRALAPKSTPDPFAYLAIISPRPIPLGRHRQKRAPPCP